jgi:outer membrane protein OmpA-like peptidoglycan-associated protein
MNKRILAIISIVIICDLIFGASGYGGGRGLFRIQDAQNEGANMVSVSSRFIFRRDLVGTSGTYHGPFLLPEFGYSPTKFLEFTGSLAGNLTYQVTPSKNYFYDWQGEVFGAKLSLPLSVAKFGVMGFYNVARANKDFLDSMFTSGPGYRALITFDFADADLTLPSLTINGGETFGHDRTIFLGGGMEIASKVVSGVVEFTAEQRWADKFMGNNTKLRLTPGIKIRLPFGLGLETGVEFGLNQATPDYAAELGLNYLSPLVPRHKALYGTITGKVVDITTGLPLAARLQIPNSKLGIIRTDPNTGIFVIDKLPVGVTILEVQNDAYHLQAAPITVKEDEITSVNFELTKLQPSGAIAGVVMDATNDQPLQSYIALQDGKVKDIPTDPVTGFFKMDNVPVGVHTVYTKKDGYATAFAVIDVKENQSTIKDFHLVTNGSRFVLQGIKFEFDRATIRPESYSILDNVATILKENAGVIVEIQGYTDNSGSVDHNQKLSLDRAQAVVKYLVDRHRIEPSRLFAQGYGELSPIVPNDTREGRIMNRRVEFLVVGEKK